MSSQEFAHLTNLSQNFSIYDEADQLAALRDSLKILDLDSANFTPARMLAQISNCKNHLITPDQFAQSEQNDSFQLRIVSQVYQTYQKILTENHALDFDDLLMKFALLLRDNPPLRDQLNRNFILFAQASNQIDLLPGFGSADQDPANGEAAFQRLHQCI